MLSTAECGLRALVLLLTGVTFAQVEFPPGPTLSGVCTVTPDQVNVLPAGYNRDILAPFSSTHLLNDTEADPIEQAAVLAGCQFQVFDPVFNEILGPNPTLTVLAQPPGEEAVADGLAWTGPETNLATFNQYPPDDVPSSHSIGLVNVSTGALSSIPLTTPLGSAMGMYPGMGPYKGQLITSMAGNQEGGTDFPAGIAAVDPISGNWTWLANSYFGLRFNNIDDVCSLSDGSVIFTDQADPNFTQHQGVAGQLPLRIYILQPDGVVRVLISNLVDQSQGYPNGAETNPEETVFYTGVSPNQIGSPANMVQQNIIYAFDLLRPASGGIFASNQRVFAVTDAGYPDGIRTDANGFVYVAAGDGVQVFAPSGKLVGKIIVTPVNTVDQAVYTIGFAGNKLLISHINSILQITLNTTGRVPAASY